MKYWIKTFGCAQNEADSERITAWLKKRGMNPAKNMESADYIVINSCMVRKMAEDRVYGLINNLSKLKIKNLKIKIVLTGCMVGLAVRDKSGKYLKRLKEIMPVIDEFLPIEEIGFDIISSRSDPKHALVPISTGCNNYCSFCVVPYTRGKEKSRPYEKILDECRNLSQNGYTSITLLGMNVNSYGADLIISCHSGLVYPVYPERSRGKRHRRDPESILVEKKGYALPDGKIMEPVLVKHLGKKRIPTLFPYLLDEIAKIKGIKKIDFLSSNPWDFSDELINIIAKNKNISRQIHLAVQSGSDSVLKRMNRWYTKKEYLDLLERIKKKIPDAKFSTDIIVGFCGETEKEFQETVVLAKKAKFNKAYVAMYSDRPMTFAHKNLKDDVLHKIKRQRWQILENLINKPNLKKMKN